MSSIKNTARACMFCGEPGRSKEHIWPKWAHHLVPSSECTTLVTFNKKGSEYSVDQVRSFRTSILETVANRPCPACNSGWMSELEMAVQPTVEPMTRGEPVWLDEPTLEVLRAWITMKMMVLDECSDPIFSEAERRQFFDRRALPANLQLTLFYCGVDEWRHNWAVDQGIWAPVGTLHKPPSATVKLIIWGFGDLLMLGMYRREVTFPTIAPDNSYREIWPGLTDRGWPPTHRLSAEEARGVRGTLQTHIKSALVTEAPQQLSGDHLL